MCSVIFERSVVLISPIQPETDVAWSTVLGLSERVECVPVESNDPLYVLYTSGTTDKPKGIQRPTAGHLVTLMYTMKTLYGLKSDDIWWAASDLGWVAGHSYICYGPLLFGITSVLYEGKPDRTPDPGQYFRYIYTFVYIIINIKNICNQISSIIQEHRVSAIFTVPTVFRVIRRVDPEIKYGRKYSIKSLRTIFIAGEHCDQETIRWTKSIFKVPILNHWWQTETGSAVTATSLGYSRFINPPPNSTGLPFVGYDRE